MRNGKYLKSATDVATMVSIFEMAGGKFKCFNEPLYTYTKDHPNSHHNNCWINDLDKSLSLQYIIPDVFFVRIIILLK